MRSGFFLFLSLLVLSLALVGCGNRSTAGTPGNPSGQPGAAQPPQTTGPGLINNQLLQGTWSTGCAADGNGYPATYTLMISGNSMRYTKETFSSWDCMGPGYPEVDDTLSFALERVSNDPNDFHVMIYNGDDTFYDWVRYDQAQVPALEFIASDYTTTGGYAHRYYKR